MHTRRRKKLESTYNTIATCNYTPKTVTSKYITVYVKLYSHHTLTLR